MTAFADTTPPDLAVARYCRSVRSILDRAGRLGPCRALEVGVRLAPEAVACGMTLDQVADALGVSAGMLEMALERSAAA